MINPRTTKPVNLLMLLYSFIQRKFMPWRTLNHDHNTLAALISALTQPYFQRGHPASTFDLSTCRTFGTSHHIKHIRQRPRTLYPASTLLPLDVHFTEQLPALGTFLEMTMRKRSATVELTSCSVAIIEVETPARRSFRK
jgi:hypothetical protein